MKRPYQITAGVLLAIAVFFAIESLKLRYYTNLGPGPGFFPFWLSVILGVLALAMLWRASFGPEEQMPADFYAPRSGYVRIALIIVAFFGAVIFMDSLGFRLVSLLFYLLLLSALGRQKPIVTAAIALLGSFGVYHVFVTWLQVPLPVGILGI